MGKVLVTGIDIGHYSMKAVVLRESKEQLELMHFHELLVPEGIFADNHTLDHQNIVKKLAELKRMLPWYCRNIAAAIPDGVVNSKVVQVAQGLDGRELEFAVGQAFGLESPIPIDELSFDFSIKSVERSLNSTLTYQVHAARKEVVEGRLLAFKKAGFKPITIDTHSHALACLWRLAAQQHGDKSQWVLADIGYQHTTLCHALPGSGVFYKDIPYGMKQIKADTRNENKTIGALVDNIKRQISLYNSVHGDNAIKGLWLSGGGANDPTLVEYFKAGYHMEVDLLSPLSLVANGTKESSKSLRNSDNNRVFGAALGLALDGIAWLKEPRDD